MNLLEKLRKRNNSTSRYRMGKLLARQGSEVKRFEEATDFYFSRLEAWAILLNDTEVIEKISELKELINKPKK